MILHHWMAFQLVPELKEFEECLLPHLDVNGQDGGCPVREQADETEDDGSDGSYFHGINDQAERLITCQQRYGQGRNEHSDPVEDLGTLTPL
jgi:hypothetical protein